MTGTSAELRDDPRVRPIYLGLWSGGPAGRPHPLPCVLFVGTAVSCCPGVLAYDPTGYRQ